MSSLIGKSIHGYHVISEIGRGAMGVVYKATDIHLERTVALKMMEASISESASFLKKFRNEAKALALSENPYIVKIYAFLETEYGFLIVMEYVDGSTLADEIHKWGTIPRNRSIKIMKQILTAINHAHRAKVIHCDIKPRNILITEQDHVKVMDFGLAQFRETSDATMTKTRAGTLCYMSPEQASKGLSAVDERSDIYSLGMTFYEILAGRTPFEKNCSDYDILEKTIHGKIPPPTKYNPEIPNTLSEIVVKAIHKDPDKRYQSAQELIDHIDYFLKQQIKPPPKPTEVWIRIIMAFLLISIMIMIGYISRPLICKHLPVSFICAKSVLEIPSLNFPVNYSIVKDPKPNFDWDNTNGAQSYQIQVDRTVNFSLPIVDTTVSKSNCQLLSSLSEGTYYWRVRSCIKNNHSNWSKPPQIFTIQKLSIFSFGKLKITSDPVGATVYLNNKRYGYSPIAIDSLEPGPYSLNLKKNGYSSWIGNPIEIKAGKTSEVTAVLIPLVSAMLILNISPSGMITLDGQSVKTNSEIRLHSDRYTVTFENPAIQSDEYKSKTSTVNLNPGENRRVTCYFEFKVSIQTLDEYNLPTWATVNIDGTDIGDTPLECPSLPAGEHIISVHRAGYRSLEGKKVLKLYPTFKMDETDINLVFHLKQM